MRRAQGAAAWPLVARRRGQLDNRGECHVDARTVIGVVLQNRRRWVVRAFVFACVAALAIAVIGAFVLGGIQESADQALN